MIRRGLLILSLVAVLTTPARAQHPMYFGVGLGASQVGESDLLASVQRQVTGLGTVSVPLRVGLRWSGEAQRLSYPANTSYASIPEVSRIEAATTAVTTAMLGLEWQPPLRPGFGPYVHAATGAARVTMGDERWSDMFRGEFVKPGGTRTVAAWSAGLGLRRPPAARGAGLFADMRYTWTDESRERRVRLMQAFAGVTF